MTGSGHHGEIPEVRPDRVPRSAATVRRSPYWYEKLGTFGWVTLSVAGGCLMLAGSSMDFVHPQAVMSLIAILLGVAGLWLVLRERYMHGMVLNSLRDIPDGSPIVLFLRAFADDPGFTRSDKLNFRRLILNTDILFKMGSVDARSEEEEIASALEPFGAMVALGAPSDERPRPGAARVYASDEEWWDEVLRGLDRANLVFLAAGPGRGLDREVREVVRRNDPGRLVIAVSRNRDQYEEFKASVGHLFPGGLPDYPRKHDSQRIFRGRYVRAVICFDMHWVPYLRMLSGRFPWTGSMRSTERALPHALPHLYQQVAVPGSGHYAAQGRKWPWEITVTAVSYTSVYIAFLILIALGCVMCAFFWPLIFLAFLVSPWVIFFLVLGTIKMVTIFRAWRGSQYGIAGVRVAASFVMLCVISVDLKLSNHLVPGLTAHHHVMIFHDGWVFLHFMKWLTFAFLVLVGITQSGVVLLLSRQKVRDWVEWRRYYRRASVRY